MWKPHQARRHQVSVAEHNIFLQAAVTCGLCNTPISFYSISTSALTQLMPAPDFHLIGKCDSVFRVTMQPSVLCTTKKRYVQKGGALRIYMGMLYVVTTENLLLKNWNNTIGQRL